MDLSQALRARLLAAEAIADLTNTIAWGGVPQGATLPYVRLTKVSSGQFWTHEGIDKLVNPRVRVETFGASAAAASALVSAIQAEMQRIDNTTAGGWVFTPPAVLEMDQGPEPDDLPGGATAHRITQDYSFFAHPEQ